MAETPSKGRIIHELQSILWIAGPIKDGGGIWTMAHVHTDQAHRPEEVALISATKDSCQQPTMYLY